MDLSTGAPGYGYPYPVDVPVFVPVIPDYGYAPPPNYGYYPPDYYYDPDDYDDWNPPYVCFAESLVLEQRT